jgi:hypothetical protein
VNIPKPPGGKRPLASWRTFITSGPGDDSQDWYASISLLPDGTTEVEHGDLARDEDYRAAVTASPADIARDLTIWLSTRG